MKTTTSWWSQQSRPQLSRRGFLQGSLLAAGGLAVSACGTTLGAGVAGTKLSASTVDYWDLFGGGDGERMQVMLDGFKKAHPELGLQSTTLAWGNPYYTKLALSTVGDQPPDAAVSHLSRVSTLVEGDLLQELTTEDLERNGLKAEDFEEKAWELCQFDGKTYALPLDTHPFVLFYNTDICKKAGLLEGDDALKSLDGPDAFVEAMDAAKKAGAAWGAVSPVNNDASTNWRIFQSLYSQLGGEVLADNGTKVVIDDDKALQVLDYLKNLADKELMPKDVDYGGAVALFASGDSAFYLMGEWEITTFQTAEMPFSMTLFPNVYGGEGGYKVQADLHTLIIPRSDGNQQRTDNALTFMRSLLEQSFTWAEGGHVPSYLPVKDSEEYKKLTPQSNYAAAAEAAVLTPPAWYSGSGSTFELTIGSAIATVRAGQGSPQQALKQMKSGLQILAETESPV
jgi:multiple sugar transport system substrate-binding protein